MKHVVVPEVATDEMVEAIDTEYRKVGGHVKDFYQAAIAAAPDTGMIAVDKAEYERLKSQLHGIKEAFEKIIDIKWRDGLRHLDNPTDYAERVAALSALGDAKVIANQALKDMEG